MDKLEHYLDQVCRSIGGSKSLRQHVRQELREHLLDAVAGHKAAGLPEEQALDRALEDFGGLEQVRSELEATHGHRLLPVVIDKAMQWKERTMKAKWLWASWAYVSLALVIALEVMLLTFIVIWIIPKFQLLLRHGMIDAAELDEHGLMWMASFLDGLARVVGNVPIWYLIIPAAALGLFEWRVRSENKPWMRLSALGTAAVGLMAVVVITAASLVIAFTLAMPAMGRMARPFALEQVATIDKSVTALEQALAKKDWPAVQDRANEASNAMNRLAAGPAVTSLTSWNEPPTVEELRAKLKTASECFRDAQQAIRDKDAARLEAEMQKFREAYRPVREAAERIPKIPSAQSHN